jgi:hypothetical protein
MRGGPSQEIHDVLARARVVAGVREVPHLAGVSEPPAHADFGTRKIAGDTEHCGAAGSLQKPDEPKPNSPEDLGFTNSQTREPEPPHQHTPKKCRSCGAEILWAQILDEHGQRIRREDGRRFKAMPVDWAPAPGGNVIVYDRPGEGFVCRVLKHGEQPRPGERGRWAHHATCPQGSDWRGR